MPRIPQPGRWPKAPQVEVCELCQRVVSVDQLLVADVEGLRGHRICIYHGPLGVEPSYDDLRGADNVVAEAIAEAVRQEPFGDVPWWDEGGFGCLLREDGTYFLREGDGLSGMRRESAN